MITVQADGGVVVLASGTYDQIREDLHDALDTARTLRSKLLSKEKECIELQARIGELEAKLGEAYKDIRSRAEEMSAMCDTLERAEATIRKQNATIERLNKYAGEPVDEALALYKAIQVIHEQHRYDIWVRPSQYEGDDYAYCRTDPEQEYNITSVHLLRDALEDLMAKPRV